MAEGDCWILRKMLDYVLMQRADYTHRLLGWLSEILVAIYPVRRSVPKGGKNRSSESQQQEQTGFMIPQVVLSHHERTCPSSVLWPHQNNPKILNQHQGRWAEMRLMRFKSTSFNTKDCNRLHHFRSKCGLSACPAILSHGSFP